MSQNNDRLNNDLDLEICQYYDKKIRDINYLLFRKRDQFNYCKEKLSWVYIIHFAVAAIVTLLVSVMSIADFSQDWIAPIATFVLTTVMLFKFSPKRKRLEPLMTQTYIELKALEQRLQGYFAERHHKLNG